MTKKDFECQVHTWMMKKAKSMIYKGEKRKGEREISEKMSEETYCYTLHSYL